MDNLLEILWQYALVFLLGAVPWVEIAVVIPLAVLAGLNPWAVAMLAFLGNWSTVYLLVVFFDKVRRWLDARRKGRRPAGKRRERAARIWNRYGMPGLALLGPLLIGSHIAVFVGILFGANRLRALLWTTASLALWTALLAVLSALGIDLAGVLRGEGGRF